MSTVDNAIARLQAIVLSSSDVTIKHAPTYPSADATVFPFSIAHVRSGEGTVSADWAEMFVTIGVDVYFSAVDLRKTYADIDAFSIEFMRRLAGDPNLNSTINTINFPVTFQVTAQEYNNTNALLCSFAIPIKTVESKVTT